VRAAGTRLPKKEGAIFRAVSWQKSTTLCRLNTAGESPRTGRNNKHIYQLPTVHMNIQKRDYRARYARCKILRLEEFHALKSGQAMRQ